MIPRTSSGRGFKGAAAYYLHDKGAKTSDRVSFTHTLNLASNEPRRAIAEMIYTAEHSQQLKEAAGIKATGRKLEKPVYTFSLSWHPTEKPSFDHMKDAGISALKALKMDHHQVLMVAHNDTEHPHIHLVVNRIDPETGKAHGLNKDHLILSKWAEAYEREHGQTWCADRVKNNAERTSEKKGRFVKDTKGQERDKRPEYDRRAKAIKAKDAARAVQQTAALSAQFARQAADKKRLQEALELEASKDAKHNDRELYRAGEIEPPEDLNAAKKAFQDQQREDKKRTLFEAWKIAQINGLQDRHNDEKRALGVRYGQKRLEAEKRIERQYGEHKRELEQRLAKLTARESKNPLGRFVSQVRGQDDEREAIEKTLANIEQRTEEIRSPLAYQEAVDLQNLKDRQEVQRANQSDTFNRQEKAGYEIPAPEPSSRGRSGDGMERSRDLS